ncbi:MAG: DUF167 domain-containing protein [Candidatus Aenigmatarchaeota archaeon]
MSERRIYNVRVEFGKERLSITGNDIVVGVTERPEKGRANLAVIKVLANHFNVPQQNVRLIRGAKSRTKVCIVNLA